MRDQVVENQAESLVDAVRDEMQSASPASRSFLLLVSELPAVYWRKSNMSVEFIVS